MVKERRKGKRWGGKEERRMIRKTMEVDNNKSNRTLRYSRRFRRTRRRKLRTKRRLGGTIEGRRLEENIRHIDTKKKKQNKN